MSDVYRSLGCAKRVVPKMKLPRSCGMSRTGTFDICKHQATSGSLALHDAVGVRKLGQQRLLSPAQESLVQRLIADKAPDQLQMPYALWSRAAVAELIEQRFGLKLKVHTMGMCTCSAGAC
jgi:hypothetical protein